MLLHAAFCLFWMQNALFLGWCCLCKLDPRQNSGNYNVFVMVLSVCCFVVVISVISHYKTNGFWVEWNQVVGHIWAQFRINGKIKVVEQKGAVAGAFAAPRERIMQNALGFQGICCRPPQRLLLLLAGECYCKQNALGLQDCVLQQAKCLRVFACCCCCCRQNALSFQGFCCWQNAAADGGGLLRCKIH